MPQRDRIEDTFKDRLGNYEYSIDEQAGWADLASQLPERTRRRRWGWWLMSGLLLLLAGSVLGYYAIYGPTPDDADTNTPLSTNTPAVATVDQATLSVLPEKVQPSVVTPATTAQTAPATAATTTGEASSTADLSANNTMADRSEGIPASSHTILADGQKQNPATQSTTATTTTNVAGGLGTKGNDELHTKAHPGTEQATAESTLSEPHTAASSVSTQARTIADAAFLPTDDIPYLLIPPYSLAAKTSSDLTPRRRRAALDWWVEPYAAYGIIQQKNVAGADSMAAVSVADFEAAHSLKESLTYGLRAGLTLKENWTISLGVERQRLQEAFVYADEQVERYKTWSDSASYQQFPDGSRMYFGDTVTVTSTTTRSVKGFPTITRWELPVTVGYQQRWDRLSLGGELGLSLNMSRAFSGTTYNATGAITTFGDDSPAYLKDNLGLSYLLGAHVGYELLPQVDLVGGVRYQYSPTAWTTAVAPVERQFQVLHLRAGVRVRFGG